jgi:hypothetical protein
LQTIAAASVSKHPLDQKPFQKGGPLSFGAPDKVPKKFYVPKITIELIAIGKKYEGSRTVHLAH